jgi:transcriptional regulator with XRE-family HTH domain
MAFNDVSNRLQQLLRSRGATQSEFASTIGTTPATVSRIAAGKAGLTVEMAHRIAAKTGVRAGWLLTGELPMYAGQDMGAIARAGYLAGWRDAVAAMEQRLYEVAAGAPAGDRPAKRPSATSALADAKRNHQELAKLGVLHAPPAKRARRPKSA